LICNWIINQFNGISSKLNLVFLCQASLNWYTRIFTTFFNRLNTFELPIVKNLDIYIYRQNGLRYKYQRGRDKRRGDS
jgi:hypothetical protein